MNVEKKTQIYTFILVKYLKNVYLYKNILKKISICLLEIS